MQEGYTISRREKQVVRQAHGCVQQVTVEKLLPLQTLESGQYTLKMRVLDKTNNQVLTPTATFTIK